MASKVTEERECRVPFKIIEGGVTAAKGFRASAVTCGIKNPEATRLDLALIVSDDGHGFDTAARMGAGTGTTSVQQRVRALGGTLDIRSAQGEGTTVEVTVPLNAQPV